MKEVWITQQEVGFGHTVLIGVTDNPFSGLELVDIDYRERFKHRVERKAVFVGDRINENGREEKLVLIAIQTDRRVGDSNRRVVLRLRKMFVQDGVEYVRGYEQLAMYSVTKYQLPSHHDPETCKFCETQVRHGFPDYEQVL
jgi:hypothetical protein